MPVTVDRPSYTIHVSRDYMSLVQSTPTEIRQLDTNAFRVDLRALDADTIGRPFSITHSRNAGVTVGGITLAGVLSINDPYTITFEDGQYAVYLQGTNNNILEKTNKNQVSVNSSNSAGLISSTDIEFSRYKDGVYMDTANGVTGTLHPKGTLELPVNNLRDAKLIAEFRGVPIIRAIGDIEFNSTDVVDGYTIIGQNPIKSNIVLTPGISSVGCEFKSATISGTLDGNSLIVNCTVVDLTYVEGIIRNCILRGTITLAGSTTTNILDCHDGIAGDDKPIIDMGGAGQALTVGGYCGEIELINKTGPDNVSIDLLAGEVVLHPSVTNGLIDVRGVGRLINQATGDAEVNWTALLSRDEYDNKVYLDTNSGISGANYPAGTNKMPVNNITDAIAIAEVVGVNEIDIKGSVILEKPLVGYVVSSNFYNYASVDLNDQDVHNTLFRGVTLEGNGLNFFTAKDCRVLGMASVFADIEDSVIEGAFVVSPVGGFRLRKCAFPGSGTSFDLSGSGNLNLFDCAGIATVGNMTSPSSSAALVGALIITILPTCTDGVIMASGTGIFNDLAAGATVIDKILPQSVWKEERSGHENTGTFGAVNEWASGSVITSGLAAGNGNGYNQIILSDDASEVDGTYSPAMIAITGGTGAGQTRGVYEYDGATKTASLDRNWTTQPDATSAYAVYNWPGRENVHEGISRGADALHITLNELASDVDDTYVGQTVFLRSGPAAEQSRSVTQYDGTTKIATIDREWSTIPDNNTCYAILPTQGGIAQSSGGECISSGSPFDPTNGNP